MKKITILSVFIVLLFGLTAMFSGSGQPKERHINLSFLINKREGYPRSDQLVVWLEKPDGSFVKTLFLSDWLSYGGYNDAEVCPDWSSKTDWESASQEEFDAVTGATPRVGSVNLDLVCSSDEVPNGKYYIFVEVHLTGEYNELHSGKIRLSRRKTSHRLEVSYVPGKYPKAMHDVLSDVYVNLNIN
jgi:hypothetical protein